MQVKSKVITMLVDGKSVLKQKDFDTIENYRLAVSYLKELSGNGQVDLIYETVANSEAPRRTGSVLFRITDKGKKLLLKQS